MTASFVGEFATNMLANVCAALAVAWLAYKHALPMWRDRERKIDRGLDALDPDTPGGITEILRRLDRLEHRKRK